jgi:hypothetical protein
VTEVDLSRADSRTSSQSGNCVEVAHNLPGLVVVRDSKEVVGGTACYMSPGTWRASMRQVHA